MSQGNCPRPMLNTSGVLPDPPHHSRVLPLPVTPAARSVCSPCSNPASQLDLGQYLLQGQSALRVPGRQPLFPVRPSLPQPTPGFGVPGQTGPLPAAWLPSLATLTAQVQAGLCTHNAHSQLAAVSRQLAILHSQAQLYAAFMSSLQALHGQLPLRPAWGATAQRDVRAHISRSSGASFAPAKSPPSDVPAVVSPSQGPTASYSHPSACSQPALKSHDTECHGHGLCPSGSSACDSPLLSCDSAPSLERSRLPTSPIGPQSPVKDQRDARIRARMQTSCLEADTPTATPCCELPVGPSPEGDNDANPTAVPVASPSRPWCGWTRPTDPRLRPKDPRRALHVSPLPPFTESDLALYDVQISGEGSADIEGTRPQLQAKTTVPREKAGSASQRTPAASESPVPDLWPSADFFWGGEVARPDARKWEVKLPSGDSNGSQPAAVNMEGIQPDESSAECDVLSSEKPVTVSKGPALAPSSASEVVFADDFSADIPFLEMSSDAFLAEAVFAPLRTTVSSAERAVSSSVSVAAPIETDAAGLDSPTSAQRIASGASRMVRCREIHRQQPARTVGEVSCAGHMESSVAVESVAFAPSSEIPCSNADAAFPQCTRHGKLALCCCSAGAPETGPRSVLTGPGGGTLLLDSIGEDSILVKSCGSQKCAYSLPSSVSSSDGHVCAASTPASYRVAEPALRQAPCSTDGGLASCRVLASQVPPPPSPVSCHPCCSATETGLADGRNAELPCSCVHLSSSSDDDSGCGQSLGASEDDTLHEAVGSSLAHLLSLNGSSVAVRLHADSVQAAPAGDVFVQCHSCKREAVDARDDGHASGVNGTTGVHAGDDQSAAQGQAACGDVAKPASDCQRAVQATAESLSSDAPIADHSAMLQSQHVHPQSAVRGADAGVNPVSDCPPYCQDTSTSDSYQSTTDSLGQFSAPPRHAEVPAAAVESPLPVPAVRDAQNAEAGPAATGRSNEAECDSEGRQVMAGLVSSATSPVDVGFRNVFSFAAQLRGQVEEGKEGRAASKLAEQVSDLPVAADSCPSSATAQVVVHFKSKVPADGCLHSPDAVRAGPATAASGLHSPTGCMSVEEVQAKFEDICPVTSTNPTTLLTAAGPVTSPSASPSSRGLDYSGSDDISLSISLPPLSSLAQSISSLSCELNEEEESSTILSVSSDSSCVSSLMDHRTPLSCSLAMSPASNDPSPSDEYISAASSNWSLSESSACYQCLEGKNTHEPARVIVHNVDDDEDGMESTMPIIQIRIEDADHQGNVCEEAYIEASDATAVILASGLPALTGDHPVAAAADAAEAHEVPNEGSEGPDGGSVHSTGGGFDSLGQYQSDSGGSSNSPGRDSMENDLRGGGSDDKLLVMPNGSSDQPFACECLKEKIIKSLGRFRCSAVEDRGSLLFRCSNRDGARAFRSFWNPVTQVWGLICKGHAENLSQHQLCCLCGHFCAKGFYEQCSANPSHRFHRKCMQGRTACPHCLAHWQVPRGRPPRSAHLVQEPVGSLKRSKSPSFDRSSPRSDDGIADRQCTSVATSPLRKRRRNGRFSADLSNDDGGECVPPVGRSLRSDVDVASGTVTPMTDGSGNGDVLVPTGLVYTSCLSAMTSASYLKVAALPTSPQIGSQQTCRSRRTSRISVQSTFTPTDKFFAETEELSSVLSTLDTSSWSRGVRQSPRQLYQAALRGELEKTLAALVHGMDPNWCNPSHNNRTAVHAAAEGGHSPILLALHKHLGDLDVVDDIGVTPVMLAVINGNLLAVEFFKESGVDFNRQDYDGKSCLHHACEHKNLEAIESLLTVRALDLNLKDGGGWTPLMWVSESNCVLIAEALVKNGAQLDHCDKELNTALHWAAFGGAKDVVSFLLQSGAAANAQTVTGDTALHIAARNEHDECVVRLLLKADQFIANSTQQLPGDVAEEGTAAHATLKLYEAAGKPLVPPRPKVLIIRDISKGREKLPVPCYNEVDSEPPPTDFVYVAQSVETRIDASIKRAIVTMDSCMCSSENKQCCMTMRSCHCVEHNPRQVCWYSKEGLIDLDIFKIKEPVLYECNMLCNCYTTCQNRLVQHGTKHRLQLFKTEKMGWGVRTEHSIPKGAFVCEYVGELISDDDAEARNNDSYIFDIGLESSDDMWCVDACHYGNVARFINHSCEPNVKPIRVFAQHQDSRFPHMALFAIEEIEPGGQICFDYGSNFWKVKGRQFSCACGTPSCSYKHKKK